jgi:hypothetical protein
MQNEVKTLIIEVNGIPTEFKEFHVSGDPKATIVKFTSNINQIPTEFIAFIGTDSHSKYIQSFCIKTIKNGEEKMLIKLGINNHSFISLGNHSLYEKILLAISACKERGHLERLEEILNHGIIIEEAL